MKTTELSKKRHKSEGKEKLLDDDALMTDLCKKASKSIDTVQKRDVKVKNHEQINCNIADQ